ncbi:MULTISPECIES: zf-HC2 domain-containing protein [Streptomyces]|uniref:Zinc-finger domain-containing protein n=1 Tax=Streptomyces luteosporeus TaxID=173856 RepID=A0ABN3TLC4_9ACTN
MTRTGTDGHPEVAEISALTEGILSPSRTADVREHLADCAVCEDVHSSLTEIKDLLGTLPGPARMPVDVAERIDAALAAEALLDATVPGADSVVSRETAEDEEEGQRSPVRVSQEQVSRETAERPSRPRPRAVTGPGRQAPAASGPGKRSPRRWSRALLGAACAAAVIGVGTFFLQSGQDTDQHADAPAPGSSQATLSPLAADDLSTRVASLLHQSFKAPDGQSAGAQGISPKTSTDGTPTTSATVEPPCVRQGIGRSEPALATHRETYDGQDAYLVVLPHPGDTQLVDAYVVASSCETASAPTPGKVLRQLTLPRR